MRHKVIWITAGMIALWMLCMGAGIAVDFQRVQQSNQATAELEWTFICNGESGGYEDISVIEGGTNFIGESDNGIKYTLMDEKGRALSDTYDLLESIGNGYVRFENTPTGIAIMEDGKNKRTIIGALDHEGQELPEEEAMEILYGEEGQEDSGNREAAKYSVKKGDRKYVGVTDSAGNWVIPPVFDKIEITDNQNYAVIRNGSNIGIAVLGGIP